MSSNPLNEWRERYPSLGYLAPFVCLLLFIAAPKGGGAYVWVEWPLQVAVVGLVCFWAWPKELSPKPRFVLFSVLLGLAVFVLWIAPEVLLPNYRQGVLFSNSILGKVGTSLRPEALKSNWVLVWRTIRASTVVPIAEELFWRGWLMRWIANPNFEKVPLGKYVPLAFWLTAILFAAEHGPYWDVGLLTGIIYNAWMIKTKSVADCILMHAVTNLALSLYVIAAGQWQYWQ